MGSAVPFAELVPGELIFNCGYTRSASRDITRVLGVLANFMTPLNRILP